MSEWILHMGVTGQESVIGATQQLAKQLNVAETSAERQERRQRALNKYRKEAVRIVREENSTAVNRLSTEEKLKKLTADRETIQKRITQEVSKEQDKAALIAKLNRTNLEISRLRGRSQGGGGGGGGAGGFFGGAALGGLATRVGGAMSRFVPGLAAYFGISSALEAGKGYLEEADMLSDEAELNHLTRTQLLSIMKAGSAAGVPMRTTLKGLNALDVVRNQAASGDAKALALLKSFGINQAVIDSEATSLDLAMLVNKSLGSKGPNAKQALGLRTLFGERWNRVLGAVAATQSLPQDALKSIEMDLETLDAANAGFESFAMKRHDLGRAITAALFRGGEGNRKRFPWMAALSPGPGPVTPASNATLKSMEEHLSDIRNDIQIIRQESTKVVPVP